MPPLDGHVQGTINTRALEVATRAEGKADTALSGLAQLRTELSDLRRENTVQHEAGRTAVSQGLGRVHERIDELIEAGNARERKLLIWLIGVLLAVLGAGLGVPLLELLQR